MFYVLNKKNVLRLEVCLALVIFKRASVLMRHANFSNPTRLNIRCTLFGRKIWMCKNIFLYSWILNYALQLIWCQENLVQFQLIGRPTTIEFEICVRLEEVYHLSWRISVRSLRKIFQFSWHFCDETSRSNATFAHLYSSISNIFFNN